MTERALQDLYTPEEIGQLREELARDRAILDEVVAARLDLDGVTVSAAVDLLATRVPEDPRQPLVWGAYPSDIIRLADLLEATGATWKLTPAIIAQIINGSGDSRQLAEEILVTVDYGTTRAQFAALHAHLADAGLPYGILPGFSDTLPGQGPGTSVRMSADTARAITLRDWTQPGAVELAAWTAENVDLGGQPAALHTVVDSLLREQPTQQTLGALSTRRHNSGTLLPVAFPAAAVRLAAEHGTLVDWAVQIIHMPLTASGLEQVVKELVTFGVPAWYLEGVHNWNYAHTTPEIEADLRAAREAREAAGWDIGYPTPGTDVAAARARHAAAEVALDAASQAERAARTRVLVESIRKMWHTQKDTLEAMHAAGRLDSFWQGEALEALTWPSIAPVPTPRALAVTPVRRKGTARTMA